MVATGHLSGIIIFHLKTWLLSWKPGFIWSTLFWLLILLPGCKQSTPTENTSEKLPPITQVTTSLEDEVKDLADNKISWSTYWKLCWEAYPEAEVYEIQIFTSEGASPTLKKQKDTCYRIQIATGINDKSLGMVNKDKLINLQKGQLGYKIRAVLENNQVSEWSITIPLAQTSK